MSDTRPIIGITMGDPAGIGPEIVVKSVADPSLTSLCRCVIIGDAELLQRVSASLSLSLKFSAFDRGDRSEAIEVVDLSNLPSDFQLGSDAAETGKASAEYIVAAVKLWRGGKIDAISTAPISKKAIGLGGYHFPGHTEFLAELTSTAEFAMSFFSGNLRVVLLSTHHPLVDAIRLVTRERLSRLIRFTDRALETLLGHRPRIAVAGLNPHASEGGMFGAEEANDISPAIEECQDVGVIVSGPYSPDTIFLRGFRGEFDAVIALYHDQATIAMKSLSFGTAVNVTLGMLLIRTSVDHGTAYDIAGRGIAEAESMKAAIKLAGELVRGSRVSV